MKKLIATVLTLAFVALGAGQALAAPDKAKLEEIKSLTQQLFTIKAQIIDKQVEAGLLDQEKAEKIKQALERHQKRVEEDLAKGQFYGFGKRGGHKGKCPRFNTQTAPSPAD